MHLIITRRPTRPEALDCHNDVTIRAGNWVRVELYAPGIYPRQRRARTQPQEHRDLHPPRKAGGDHRSIRIRQEFPGFRHHLRRGPTPLRRVALGLRPPVPGPDGQARRRLHRGPLAGHLHRPERGFPQPPFHGGHRNGDLRLSASSFRQSGPAPLPQVRPPRRTADHLPDRGRHHESGRRQPDHVDGAQDPPQERRA